MQLLLGYGLQFLKRKYNGLATPIPFLRFLNLREIQKFAFEAAYIHTYIHTLLQLSKEGFSVTRLLIN